MKAAYLLALVMSASAISQNSVKSVNAIENWDSHTDANDHHIFEAVREEEETNRLSHIVKEDPNSVKSLLKNAAADRRKMGVFTEFEEASMALEKA